jgi:C4-dicarboxylate-specific signal transduction histidine kinase
MKMPISPAAFDAVQWTSIIKTLAKLAICIVAVTAVTTVLYEVPLSDRSAFSALAFLFVVLIISLVWGFSYAVFVSFLTVLGFSWLLPPVGVFWLDDPRDILTLAAFLLIGIITSHLSERVRRETLNAKQCQAEAVAAHQVARRSEQELREVHMELAHANRVATIGQLTASIAHEVNQPIAATVINAEAASRFLSAQTVDLDKVRQIQNDIVKDGNRAAEVISRIRGLIKKSPPRRDRLEINGAIREVIELTRGEADKKGIAVHAELPDHLPHIHADRVQLQQVILNLIINAIQAMSGPSEGIRELHIAAENCGDEGVRVAVRDCGPGLSEESLQRLFEPFYTTKPDGMGMGLSICRSIIEDHGGRLWATRLHPHGALFQFTIPTHEVIE